MLKVTLHTEAGLNRLVIEGRLVQDDLSELTHVWLRTREADRSRAIEADLTEVTYVDDAAIELLVDMHSQAVRLTGAGTMTRALIQQVADAAASRGFAT